MVKSSMARSLPVENLYYHRMLGQLSTTCINVLKQPNGELLVAVNHNRLRTMASQTVDPIDWSHHPPSWAVPPELLVHSINQCNLSTTRTCNRSMRGNHLVCAATQGMAGGICGHIELNMSKNILFLITCPSEGDTYLSDELANLVKIYQNSN